MDKEALDLNFMTDRDIELLNAYHKDVCETLLPHMKTEEERTWLQEACAPISR